MEGKVALIWLGIFFAAFMVLAWRGGRARELYIKPVDITKIKPAAYEWDDGQNEVDLGEISLADAEALLRRKLDADVSEYYYTDEAMAATVFGLKRSGDHYIELECFQEDAINVRVGGATTDSGYMEDAVVSGFLPALRLVEAYFRSVEAFSDAWRALPDRR